MKGQEKFGSQLSPSVRFPGELLRLLCLPPALEGTPLSVLLLLHARAPAPVQIFSSASSGEHLEYSSWPTFPQLYIDGEFFGGCDITVEAYQNGQLQQLLEKAMCS